MTHPADRMLEKKFGIFNHFLYGNPGNGEEKLDDYDWNACVQAVDVEAIAAKLHAMRAGYYFITVMQGKKYMIAPNSAFDAIAGTLPGEACATRDLVLDLYEALHRYGIDLYLYFTGDGPYQDPVAGPRFGFVNPRQDVSDAFVDRWASVLREYAVRYGEKVCGWWVDGCYDFFGYNAQKLRHYYDAIKAGNPNAITTFNNGVKEKLVKWFPDEEITSGEFNEFTYIPETRFIDGAQAHILAPLGVSANGEVWGRWRRPGSAYSHADLRDYIRKVNAVGGSVTVDIYIDRYGRFDEEQVAVMTMTDL